MSTDIYDDVEQSERVRNWLSENGSSLVIGLLAAFAAVFGWQKYMSYQEEQQYQAAATYSVFDQQLNGEEAAAATTQLEQLQTHYAENLYTDLAALRMASKWVADGELERASEALEQLRASTQHAGIANIAALRQARLAITRDQADQALAIINGINAADDMTAALAEVRGDALARQGRSDEARAAYSEAIAALGGTPRQLLELKYQSVGGDKDDAAAEADSNS
ncbi:MAG: tetratricopeptide repeat protein [Wenzhouxiangellaceae bacterium]